MKFKFNKNKGKELREKYSIKKNTFVYLYLGRINKEKGISELVKAFKKINDNDVFLIIVGSIEDKSLKNLFKKKKKFYILIILIALKIFFLWQMFYVYQVTEKDSGQL